MKIGIDCRLSGKKHGGIGRYIEQLLTQLVGYKNHSWVFFFHDSTQVGECFPKGVPKHCTIRLLPIRHYTVKEQLYSPWYYYRENLDLLHIPHFNIPLLYLKKTIVTIHDLLWHTQKGAHVTTLSPLTYWLKYCFYRFVTRCAITKASTILVPSQTIKETIVSFYPWAQRKITITKEGVDLVSASLDKNNNVVKIVQTAKDYLLYVGSLYPHKNVELILKALTQNHDLSLIISGSRSVFQKEIESNIQKYTLEDRVFFTGFVSDEELSYLYTHAKALVQPSFSEGFGLTGIEALALRTPILASNIPIFKEIYQDYAIYFDPHSVSSFLQALQTLHKQPKKIPASVSTEIIKEYNWEKMAATTIAAYENILRK